MDKTPEHEQSYYKKIEHLLSHYEDGWDVFINAHKAKSFDYPLTRKPEFENDPYLPKTWLALVAETQAIIATDKFGLDYYQPQIEIIRPDHMLDVYTTIGLPGSYKHWSFGKKRMQEERKYDENKHLAYEIVINSDPSIAYCMATNTPVMQALVIAHACYGHNAVFKNNYLFKEFTNAKAILSDVKTLREFVFECEQKYGADEVSDFLDFCHAMQFMDTPDTAYKKVLTKSQQQARMEEKKRLQQEKDSRVGTFNTESSGEGSEKDAGYVHRGAKNILGYMADHDEYFPQWKRTIMRMRSELSQYFKPQMMTKTLNEGFATYTHTRILETMVDMGLLDYGMHMEFRLANEGVLHQPSAIRLVKGDDGKVHEQLVGASMNPYALGFRIFEDIERICNNPTDEDREWFKHFAGQGDAMDMIKHAMENCSDETFIEQYMSPTVMRKFSFFAVDDLAKNNYYEVTAIHDREGYRQIRSQLAANNRLSDHIPDIRVHDYQIVDRCLILRHQMVDGKRLDVDSTLHILELMHSQRGFPVVIESVNEYGTVESTLSSPMKYDYKKHSGVLPKLAP